MLITERMQIFVRSDQQTYAVSLKEDATLVDLKNAIEDVEFIPTNLQRIVKESCTLTDGLLTGVLQDADMVELLLSVDGGMRAKWRKKRMRRLRRKRRKMRNTAK